MQATIFDPHMESIIGLYWESIEVGESGWEPTPWTRTQGQAWYLEQDVEDFGLCAVIIYRDQYGFVSGFQFWQDEPEESPDSITAGRVMWGKIRQTVTHIADMEERGEV